MERFFFVEKGDYKVGDFIDIVGVEHNHLSKVLRSKVGDKIVCLQNDGKLMFCEIVSFSKVATRVTIEKIEHSQNECETSLTAFLPLLKGEKFEFLVTKLSELGVKKIIPFKSVFATAKEGRDKSQRLEQIARDACKQCRRANTIEIENVLEFDEMVERIKDFDSVIFAYENERQSKLSALDFEKKKNVAFIVGSEGGFSEDECEKIVNAGAKIVSLGNRILRAETAVITLASILQYKLNEI